MFSGTAVVLLAALATAETSSKARAQPVEDSLEEDEARLLLARATYGARPGDLDRLLEQGTTKWLDRQLRPDTIPDPIVEAKLERFGTLELSTPELMKKYPRPSREEREARGPRRDGPAAVLRELSEAKLVRAVHSERQLEEVMTDFWFNHFNVYARKNRNTILALSSYERDAIRPHALGRFDELLVATAQHPAMLFYLDNWISTKDGFNPRDALREEMGRRVGGGRRAREARTFGINENYARELMELHTLGVDGGYDQSDVIEVARALTGWTVVGPEVARIRARIESRGGRRMVPASLRAMPDEGSFFFNEKAHDSGSKRVLGKTVDSGGIDDGLSVMALLAAHSSTARFISTKIAERFVSDTPSDALVREMSETFSKTDGDIRAVLRSMFLSPRFVAEALASDKVKTPLELVASAARATGADVRGPALAHLVSELGMPLYRCQPPTGYEEDASAWLSAGSILNRVRLAGALAPARPEIAERIASPDFQRQ